MSKRKKKRKHPKKKIRNSIPGPALQPNIDQTQTLQEAVRYHQAGEFDRAKVLYKDILSKQSNHSEALHLLGVTAFQTGQNSQAIDLIGRAIQINPRNPLYYFNIGVAYKGDGRLDDAISSYQKAVEIKPDYAECYFNIGNLHKEKGEFEKAVEFYGKAIELDPKSIKSFYNLGNTLKETGQLEKAISAYEKILEINPQEAKANYNIGTVYQIMGRTEKASEFYRKAIDQEPNNPRANNNFGNILQSQGKMEEATVYYRKALELNPEYAIAYFNLANVLQGQDKLDEAVSTYEQAEKHGFGDADLFINMGLALRSKGDLERAAEAFRKAVEVHPDHSRGYSSLVHHLQYMCAWEEFDKFSPKLDQLTLEAIEKGENIVESPFENITRHDDAARNIVIANKWAAEISASAEKVKALEPDCRFSFEDRKSKTGPIIIGYLSNDFCNHPVAHLMLGLLQLHNRDRFRIHCYSYGRDDKSFYRKSIERRCDKFVDIRNAGHGEAAKAIFADKVDILVDLMGYTKHNRLGICALKPAPVQATYLGFPGSTGSEFIDYIVTDKVITPESDAPHYSEKFVYLPHTYIVTDNNQNISAKRFNRADFGLPEEGFVFCSFNQPYKIEPEMFDVWMEFLREIPGSALWLPKRKEPVQINLRREAEARGVSPERLVFADKVPGKDEHLARLRLADLGLDTRLYNGHATTLDTLWAGVPVVTLQGNHFASRAASSFLLAIDMPELITHSLDEYRRLVLRLSQDPEELQAARRKLSRHRLVKPLFDTPRFVRNLEIGFREMWDNYQAGEAPRLIEVNEQPSDGMFFSINEDYHSLDRMVFEEIERPSEEGVDVFPISYPPAGPPSQPSAVSDSAIDREFAKAVQRHQVGKIEDALRMYGAVLERRPNHSDALHLRGVAFYQMESYQKAEDLIRRAIEINPKNGDYHSNLGVVLQRQGRLDESIAHFRRAIALKPEFPDAYNNIGPALKSQGKLDEAVSCYQKAIELKPDYPEAFNNLGNVYQSQGKMAEAVSCFQKAIESKADYHEAYYNMGNALQNQGKLEEAISSFEKALEIKPDYTKAFSILFYRLKYVCAWEKVGRMSAQLDALTDKALAEGIKTAETPFINLTTHADPARNFAVARSWAESIEKGAALSVEAGSGRLFSFEDRNKHPSKIRIGYLSNDFFDHPVAHQICSLFSVHDRERFEIYAYSYGKDENNEYRKQIENTCDRFVNVKDLSHMEAAERIFEDQIDILVDLMGHTKDNRLAICAYRPAPIQVTYLGYPGTTGARFFDYIITDRTVTPEDHAPWYSEKFVFMPHSYMVNNHTQSISRRRFSRSDFQLPEDGFVFCSFNQPYKIEPMMFDVWMRILKQVPDSVLWLSKRVQMTQDNLAREARKRGVAPERLILGNKLPSKGDHLARLQLADLVLDTRIYNGHATTNDALWAGLPVITMKGSHFASRAGASFLHALDLPELIASDLEEFEKLALRLASNPSELKSIREKLSRNRWTQPLFDTPRFAGNLESAFTEMWGIYQNGGEPRQIEVMEVDQGFPTMEFRRAQTLAETSEQQGKSAGTDVPNHLQDIGQRLQTAFRFHQSGQFEKAREGYQEVLKANPIHPDTLHLLGVLAHQTGDHKTAVELIQQAIRYSPGNAPYYSNLGSAYHALGNSGEALASYEKAVELKPDFAEALFNKGLALKVQGKTEDALVFYDKALQIKPDYAEAQFNKGIAYQSLGRFQDALGAYQRTMDLQPGYAKVYNNMGTLYQGKGMLNEAIGFYRKAIEVKPDYAESHFNLGNCLKDRHDLEAAAASYQKALNLKPERPEFYIGLGNLLKEQNRLDEAVSAYEQALRLKPDYEEAIGSLFHCVQNVCDWPRLRELSEKLDASTHRALAEDRMTGEVPFVHLTRKQDPASNFRVAKSWSDQVVRNISHINLDFSFNDRVPKPEKLRIGYLSNDFCNHPVSHLMVSLFGLHDREKFSVFAYSHGKDDGSSYRKRIRESCDKFVDLRLLNHVDAAKAIYEDRIDILVDLMGHTKGKRLEICALRPAPIQMTYLGFPGTTGADFFDYITTDRIVTPESEASYYSEKFLYLPDTYMITDFSQEISPREWTKPELGIRPEQFVFCSLNKAYKIEPVIFTTWMQILKQVSGSVLMLRQISEKGVENLKREAESLNISSDRLIFIEKLPSKAEYLARLKVADLVLDTRVYNGHATTCDALWAGVPVLTLQGNHFASRAASSLLKAVGLPELITDSLEEYEGLAVDLASNPEKLNGLRRRLMVNRYSTPLFDTPRFTGNLEKIYQQAWKAFFQDNDPKQKIGNWNRPAGVYP